MLTNKAYIIRTIIYIAIVTTNAEILINIMIENILIT